MPTPGLSGDTTRPGAPLLTVSRSDRRVWKKSPNERGLVLEEPKHIQLSDVRNRLYAKMQIPPGSYEDRAAKIISTDINPNVIK